MGVDVTLAVATVSFLSGALGAVAGVLIGLNYDAIQPYMGESMMLRGFAVIVLGGVGDVRGALVAGLILGLLETLTAGYIASSLKDAIGFALLVLTLWTRPTACSAARRSSARDARAFSDFFFTYQTLIYALGINGLLA